MSNSKRREIEKRMYIVYLEVFQYVIVFLNGFSLAIMTKNTRYNKKLTKITNINEDCSEVSPEEDQYELGESGDYNEDSEPTETAEMEGSSGNEEENFFNISRNKKRARIISSSDTEDKRTSILSTSRDVMEEIEIAVDRTRWVRLKGRKSVDRPSAHTTFKDNAERTGYGKRNIILCRVV
nr:uncharacterized protein LOC118681841 isoform X1 [Bactrocera oleae]